MEPELLLIKSILKKGSVVLDIGANVGEYIYIFEKTKAKKIFAFEPIPKLFDKLKSMFKSAEIFDYAVSDRNGKAILKIPEINDNTFLSRATLKTDYLEPGENGCSKLNVNTISLDNFFNKYNYNLKKLDFIKIDVEGNENKVIDGAYNTIEKFKPMLMVEIEQRHHKNDIKRIFQTLLKKDYEYFFYSLDKKQFIHGSVFSVSKHQKYRNIKTSKYINNFWFVHKSDSYYLELLKC